jgi:hypothetical protein
LFPLSLCFSLALSLCLAISLSLNRSRSPFLLSRSARTCLDNDLSQQ